MPQNPTQYLYPDAVLQVFCKAPVAGQVKTRLQPQLSAVEATAVHKQLALRTFQLLSQLPYCPVQLWCAPDTEHGFFQTAAQQFGFSLHTQSPGDIGQRMDEALASGLRSARYALLLGCDCPSFKAYHLKQALHALQTHEVVLAPTEDGGYSLIGLRQAQPALFIAMPWSTPAVLPITRQRLRTLRLTAAELPTQWDVDTYADYLRYLSEFPHG